MGRELTYSQRVERALLTDYRKAIWRPFLRGVREYALIRPGDRIAVCVSGGKDSMLLAKLMQLLERTPDVPFEARYVIMDPGYAPEVRARIEDNARRLEIPYTLFESDVFAAAADSGKRPCFMCARMRRGCLYEQAKKLGCNRIALGHHMNDVIETALLSMFYGGQVQGMLPKVRAEHFPGMALIRPLYRVREADILQWSAFTGLEFARCACRLTRREGDSRRAAMKALIRKLGEENPNIEANLFGSLHTVQLDTLPGWKTGGAAHSFLERFDSLEED